MPQIRWEWKRAFLRIWKLPTKIFHHIKKENPIHATLADAFLLQGRFLRKYIKRQIKWHSSQRKLFYDIFLTSKSTFQNLYIGGQKALWWFRCNENGLKDMIKFSKYIIYFLAFQLLKSRKTDTFRTIFHIFSLSSYLEIKIEKIRICTWHKKQNDLSPLWWILKAGT